MEVAFIALTDSCTFLLDADGICRYSVLRPDADKTTREAAKRCLNAQYVASIDPKAEGLLVHEPKPGRSLLFARVSETGRVALVRSGPLLEFQTLDAKQDEEQAGPPRSAHGLAQDASVRAVAEAARIEDEQEEEEETEKVPHELAQARAAEAEAAPERLPPTVQKPELLSQSLAAAAERIAEEDRNVREHAADSEPELPLSAEIAIALDRLDLDRESDEAGHPLDFALEPHPVVPVAPASDRSIIANVGHLGHATQIGRAHDDDPTVERPSAHPPPLSMSILNESSQTPQVPRVAPAREPASISFGELGMPRPPQDSIDELVQASLIEEPEPFEAPRSSPPRSSIEAPRSAPPRSSIEAPRSAPPRSSIEAEAIEPIEADTAEHPSARAFKAATAAPRAPAAPSSLAARGLPERPSSPQSPENMLAKVMLHDDIGEEVETLLVVEPLNEVEADDAHATARFSREIVLAAPSPSEPSTRRAPTTLPGFPGPPPRIVQRRGLLPRINR